jgi:hypothetical protein
MRFLACAILVLFLMGCGAHSAQQRQPITHQRLSAHRVVPTPRKTWANPIVCDQAQVDSKRATELPFADYTDTAKGFEDAASEYSTCANELEADHQLRDSVQTRFIGVMVLAQAATQWDESHDYARSISLNKMVIDECRSLLATKKYKPYVIVESVNGVISAAQDDIAATQSEMSN